MGYSSRAKAFRRHHWRDELPPPRFDFRVRKRKVRQPNALERLALDQALPDGSPLAVIWKKAIFAGQVYPPPGVTPMPNTCQQPGDHGRYYPGNYVTGGIRGPRCCLDCLNHHILAHKQRLARWESAGSADPDDMPPEDSSPSTAVLEAMENAGVEIVECPLPSENIEDLQAYIARGVPESD